MADRQLVTRKTLQRELALNAATKPLALTVGAGVAVAAFVLSAPWLLAVAVAMYAAIAVTTLFDPDEAGRVGRAAYRRAALPKGDRELPEGLAPEISALVHRAHVEEHRIRRAVEDSGLPFTDVSVEVEHLMSELERNARRAQVVWTYLSEQRPFELQRRLQALRAGTGGRDAETARSRERTAAALEHQLQVGETLRFEYARFGTEVEHLIASLGVVHGELVRISIAGDAIAQEGLADQVRDLRSRVGAVAEGMSEAAEQLGR